MRLCRILIVLILLQSILPSFAAHSAEAPATVAEVLTKKKGGSFTERLEFFSRLFLGRPYASAPTGDGPHDRYDTDPRYRFDKFDCTTYVESVLALSASTTAEDFERWIDRIRYHGKPSFLTRNHFPCVDWLPKNTDLGFLEDVTEKVGSRWEVLRATGPVKKSSWFHSLTEKVIRLPEASAELKKSRLAELKKNSEKFATITPSLPYITLSSFIKRREVPKAEADQRKQEEDALVKDKTAELLKTHSPLTPEDEEAVHAALIDFRLHYLIQDTEIDPALLDAIPTATLLNVVRPDWSVPGTRMNISHQGFVFRKGKDAYFRHNSLTGKRAKDVLLANYLRLCLLVPSIKGINLQAIHEPKTELTKSKRRVRRSRK